MSKRASRTAQLAREDWLDAAQRLVAMTGVGGLKVQELAASLGSTTGSLYWHFENREELVRALVDHWRAGTEKIALHIRASTTTAEERLLDLMRIVADDEATAADLAMRAWASLDRRTARIVKQVDERRTEVVRGLFLEMGFDEDDATMRTRAILTYEPCERHVFASLPRAERDRALVLRHKMLCARS